MHDLRITGGTIIDGTGGPRRQADVGVSAGRIVAIGSDVGPATRTIDATDQVVAPGFVDTHTHLDAQLFWDPQATPSPLHGVTTVLGGNCGFTVAPLKPEHAEYLRRMLARVEGMPLESLEAGLQWDWATFGEWLGGLDGRIAVNAGFSVGHSTLRRLAMGDAATEADASPEQLADMIDMLHRSLSDGALGLTSSLALSHSDGNGRPVPSRRATHPELLALASAVGDHPGTFLGVNPGVGPFGEPVLDLLAGMSSMADRVLNWNALQVYASRWDDAQRELATSDYAAQHGGHVVAQAVPDPRRFYVSFLSGFLFDALPGWIEVFTMPLAERMHALGDPVIRERLQAGVVSEDVPAMLRFHTNPARMSVVDTFAPANRGLNGRRVEEIAAVRGTSPFDTLLDIALSDELRTVFLPDPVGDDDRSWELRSQVLADPRTVIGAADAGAHLDVASSFNYTTSVLAGLVRRRGLLTLEQAVRQLTDVPARLFGVRGRGRVAEGWFADLVVFDPDTVGPLPEEIRYDLPAGARRIYAGAVGVTAVLVNGEPVAEEGTMTPALPGTVLRSGRDTETVTVASARALTAAT